MGPGPGPRPLGRSLEGVPVRPRPRARVQGASEWMSEGAVSIVLYSCVFCCLAHVSIDVLKGFNEEAANQARMPFLMEFYCPGGSKIVFDRVSIKIS